MNQIFVLLQRRKLRVEGHPVLQGANGPIGSQTPAFQRHNKEFMSREEKIPVYYYNKQCSVGYMQLRVCLCVLVLSGCVCVSAIVFGGCVCVCMRDACMHIHLGSFTNIYKTQSYKEYTAKKSA